MNIFDIQKARFEYYQPNLCESQLIELTEKSLSESYCGYFRYMKQIVESDINELTEHLREYNKSGSEQSVLNFIEQVLKHYNNNIRYHRMIVHHVFNVPTINITLYPSRNIMYKEFHEKWFKSCVNKHLAIDNAEVAKKR